MNDTKHYCQLPDYENEIPEPRGCCSGTDCGCMGMPIDPPYYSHECMKIHSIEQRLEVANERIKKRRILIIGEGAGKTVMAIVAHTAITTNDNLTIVDPITSSKERNIVDVIEETIQLINQLGNNQIYPIEDKHPFQKFIGKPAHPYRRKK